MSWLAHFLLVAVPFAIGFATATAPGTTGWVIFGLSAFALVGLAVFSEMMRKASNTTGLKGFWGNLPIIGLIAGRLAGSYGA